MERNLVFPLPGTKVIWRFCCPFNHQLELPFSNLSKFLKIFLNRLFDFLDYRLYSFSEPR
ncbi:Hypothetical predicted protein [Olea europaea subsp. europaea]|uniref:Uncharacterized protein n=1 Tax=Olea europaea subsp. europaea TaxID=158383 RepID=A0A8S0TXC6_OLEEU|nr:Hypothetical predicted protein [Olea europaea subsp. europaea]